MKTRLGTPCVAFCVALIGMAFGGGAWAESGTWTPTGQLNETGTAVATPLLDGRVLQVMLSEERGRAVAEVYDPRTGKWTPTAPTASPGAHARTVTVLDGTRAQCGSNCGKVLVSFGCAPTGGPGHWELYDPVRNAWAPAGKTVLPRIFIPTATLLSGDDCGKQCGQVLVVGGKDECGEAQTKDDETLRSAELYDPKTNTWRLAPAPANQYSAHAATALSDGRVLVAGGIFGKFSEVYDPATAAWAPTAPLAASHDLIPIATQLLDGRVLLLGGNDEGTVEVYDPKTNAWSAAPSCKCLEGGGSVTPAARLPDGNVLVASGAPSAFVYRVSDATWMEVPSPLGDQGYATATVLTGSRCGVQCGSVLVAGGSENAAYLYHAAGAPEGSTETQRRSEGSSAGNEEGRSLLPIVAPAVVILAVACGLLLRRRGRH